MNTGYKSNLKIIYKVTFVLVERRRHSNFKWADNKLPELAFKDEIKHYPIDINGEAFCSDQCPGILNLLV